mgnify:CR=1 FL=1
MEQKAHKYRDAFSEAGAVFWECMMDMGAYFLAAGEACVECVLYFIGNCADV